MTCKRCGMDMPGGGLCYGCESVAGTLEDRPHKDVGVVRAPGGDELATLRARVVELEGKLEVEATRYVLLGGVVKFYKEEVARLRGLLVEDEALRDGPSKAKAATKALQKEMTVTGEMLRKKYR